MSISDEMTMLCSWHNHLTSGHSHGNSHYGFLQLPSNNQQNKVTSHSATSKVTITWICKPFTTNIHCARCTNVFPVTNLRLFIEIQLKKKLLTKSELMIRRRSRRRGQ